MNDVLNAQGYTQAAWWNRIPGSAWGLMFGIALFCNWLVGYGAAAWNAEAVDRAAAGGGGFILPDRGYR